MIAARIVVSSSIADSFATPVVGAFVRREIGLRLSECLQSK